MRTGLYIFIDDEFTDPVYAEPKIEEQDPALWATSCEIIDEALEEERPSHGVVTIGETRVAWHVMVKQGVSFVVMVSDDVKPSLVEKYLTQLARRYSDEVDDLRNPERDGVGDVIDDVIPPWEDEEED